MGCGETDGDKEMQSKIKKIKMRAPGGASTKGRGDGDETEEERAHRRSEAGERGVAPAIVLLHVASKG